MEKENPNAKVINQGFREQVNQVIKDKKVYEAILVDRNGHITESKSNIFMVYENKVITSLRACPAWNYKGENYISY